MPILFILFIALPIAELFLLVEVGGHIGGLNTVLLVIATAVIGSYFLRREGLATLASVQAKMQQGEMPVNEMVAGLALAAGGALLLTPGFMTDAVGFILVLPGSRGLIGHWLIKRVISNKNMHFSGFTQAGGRADAGEFGASNKQAGDVIEGEYEEKPPKS